MDGDLFLSDFDNTAVRASASSGPGYVGIKFCQEW
jgi:hypothetical protein